MYGEESLVCWYRLTIYDLAYCMPNEIIWQRAFPGGLDIVDIIQSKYTSGGICGIWEEFISFWCRNSEMEVWIWGKGGVFLKVSLANVNCNWLWGDIIVQGIKSINHAEPVKLWNVYTGVLHEFGIRH